MLSLRTRQELLDMLDRAPLDVLITVSDWVAGKRLIAERNASLNAVRWAFLSEDMRLIIAKVRLWGIA